MKFPGTIFLLCVLAPVLRAQDTVHMTDGSKRNVKILGVQGDSYVISLPSPIPGQAAGTTTMKQAGVSRIMFGPDPLLDAVASSVGPGSIASARSRWQTLQPFLGIPESRAGEAGCLLGEILLQGDDSARHDEAAAIFAEVEKGSWNVGHRQRATRGRLAVLIKKGKLEEASLEAEEIERLAEEPDLVIETRLLLAEARRAALEKLLADNPRWSEDPPVREERARLINEGLEFALFPYLFHGTQRGQAARGLWLAHKIHRLADDNDAAREVATDLTAIYSETPEAAQAAALPEKES